MFPVGANELEPARNWNWSERELAKLNQNHNRGLPDMIANYRKPTVRFGSVRFVRLSVPVPPVPVLVQVPLVPVPSCSSSEPVLVPLTVRSTDRSTERSTEPEPARNWNSSEPEPTELEPKPEPAEPEPTAVRTVPNRTEP